MFSKEKTFSVFFFQFFNFYYLLDFVDALNIIRTKIHAAPSACKKKKKSCTGANTQLDNIVIFLELFVCEAEAQFFFLPSTHTHTQAHKFYCKLPTSILLSNYRLFWKITSVSTLKKKYIYIREYSIHDSRTILFYDSNFTTVNSL